MHDFTLPQELISLIQSVRDAGGRALLVGGAVRDQLRRQPVTQDFDIEVYGLKAQPLKTILRSAGKVLEVGKTFGIFNLQTASSVYDLCLPRLETKTGFGHKNFRITTDPDLQYQKAAYRRDFTVNTIGFDPLTGQYLDPFFGREDLRRGILRHVGTSFGEDPLRVLRAVQFSGRFRFRVAPETARICRGLNLNELPKERIFEEFRKLLLRAQYPSIGLETARTLGVLDYLPELKSLIAVPQNPYPGTDLWTHTLRVIDAAATLKQEKITSALTMMLSALCLELGTPLAMIRKNRTWSRLPHTESRSALTQNFLKRLTDEKKLIQEVDALVREQHQPLQLYQERSRFKPSAVRRLALRVPIQMLVRLARAKHLGKLYYKTKTKEFPEGDWLLQQAKLFSVAEGPPKPILMGRDILKRGMRPGPRMGILLEKAFEAQLNGEFQSFQEAQCWIEKQLSEEPVPTEG